MSRGVLYVIAFSDGSVKVGRAREFDSRKRQHANDASKFGIKILRDVHSREIEDVEAAETELIKFAKRSSNQVIRKEYLRGADFDALAGFMFTSTSAARGITQRGSVSPADVEHRRGDLLWNAAQYAEFVGITVGKAAQQRYHGNGPRYVVMGQRSIRYWRSDVVAWLEERGRFSTDPFATNSPL